MGDYKYDTHTHTQIYTVCKLYIHIIHMDILRVASWAIHHVLLASSNVSVKLGVACWSAVVAGSSSTTGKKPLRPNLVFFSLLSGHENAEKMALDMENHGQSQDFCWTSDFRGEFHLWPVRILRAVAVSSAPERQAPWQSVVNQCLRLCLCTPGQIIQRDQTFFKYISVQWSAVWSSHDHSRATQWHSVAYGLDSWFLPEWPLELPSIAVTGWPAWPASRCGSAVLQRLLPLTALRHAQPMGWCAQLGQRAAPKATSLYCDRQLTVLGLSIFSVRNIQERHVLQRGVHIGRLMIAENF